MDIRNQLLVIWALEHCDIPSELIRWEIMPALTGDYEKMYNQWCDDYNHFTSGNTLIGSIITKRGFENYLTPVRPYLSEIPITKIYINFFSEWAIDNGYFGLLRWWYIERMIPSEVNKDTSFTAMCQYHCYRLLKWIKENYPDTNVDSPSSFSSRRPIDILCKRGDFDMIKWLCYTNRNNDISSGNKIKWLLDNESPEQNIDVCIDHTCIMLAYYNGHLDVVKWLIRTNKKYIFNGGKLYREC